jgi:hypothetical protein
MKSQVVIRRGAHSSFQTWELNGAMTVSSNYQKSTNAELIFCANKINFEANWKETLF